MRTRCLMGTTAVALLAGSAFGQITQTPPFTGPYTESFETQVTPAPFPLCVADRVFNNTADMCAPNGSAHITSGWSFMCVIFPHSGSRFAGSTGGAMEVTFDTPVNKFGAYMGTNSGTDGGTATFFDASNAPIGTPQTIETAGCTWTWN